METNQISFDEIINNQDVLLRACNETFGNDGNITQPFFPSQSTFLAQSQPQIMQPQQKQQHPKSQLIEVMAKEINELKNRVKSLEDSSQAQPTGIQLSPINIPLRLDVAEHVIPTGQGIVIPTGQGIGAATKNISMTKRKKTK